MSEHRIEVAAGASVRLPTAGKYCDRDIVVTAENGGVELPELTNPGTAEDLVAGKELIDGDGNVVVGTYVPLDTSDATATADDIVAGATAYVNGEKITGTIKKNRGGVQKNVVPQAGGGSMPYVQMKHTFSEKTLFDPEFGGTVTLQAPFESFGDATADDVAKGKTFTSAAGLLVVGTREDASGEPDPREQYQRVEYIEAAEEGTYPYIITDFCADNICGVEVIASFPSLVDRIPMGSRENSDPTRFYCVYPLSANSIYYGFDTGVTISCKLTVDTIYRLQTNFLNSRLVNVYEEDGTRKGGGAISDTLTQQTAPVAIFGYNYASTGAVSSKREFRLYGARCSRGHEVAREYIPCYRKSDGVVGVFEKFTGQFLTNADPEGSAFAKGPDVEW